MSTTINIKFAYQHCQKITRTQAKNFYYAFITLSRAKRQAIYAAYAFCRLCDDITDEPLSQQKKVSQLTKVRERLQNAYTSSPDSAIFVALQDAAKTFSIPKQYFEEVIRGVEMDLDQSRYQTFEDLYLYCYRVAASVGLISVQIFQYSNPIARNYAIDLGIAMQLTNILRDLKEDAERGRVYLPQAELEQFGYSESELFHGIINENFTRLMRFQIERARRYFDSGKRLLPLLSRRSRSCPAVLHGLYSRVLDRIEAQDYNVFERRVRLSSCQKLRLTTKLWLRSIFLPSEVKNHVT